MTTPTPSQQFRDRFKRTKNAKPIEAIPCRTKPGVLIPGDAERMRDFVDPTLSLEEFAEHYLEASEGALCEDRTTGRRYRLPTLVPRQRPNGRCIFLSDEDRCQCHPVSPAGCAYFDLAMSHKEGAKRSQFLHAVIQHGDLTYDQLHKTLTDNNQTAQPLARRTADMNEAIEDHDRELLKKKYKVRKKRKR